MTEEIKKDAGAVPAPQKSETPEKQTAPVKKEKPEKCEQCGKPLNRVKWYYRNGGYYCTNRCWKEFKAKIEEEKKKAEAGSSEKT